jgi:tetratricopeptide (TPR) repeat protein
LQAKFFDSLTQFHLALKEEPDRLFTLSLTASLLATCPDSSIRNGAEAVTLANRANQLTGGKDPAILDTLSAAYAEEGRFAKAMEIEQQALELATQQGNATLTSKLKTHLGLYSSNEPLRVLPDSASF